jgi:hypothetical protein
VRFNLSVDDRFAANQSPCSLRAGATYSGLRFYNNTVAGADLSWGILGSPNSALLDPAGLELHNNVFLARPAQAAGLRCPVRCTANLWSGLPSSGADALAADPLLRDPARRGRGRVRVGLGFRPRPGSPPARSGTVIAGSPRVDYFGAPLTTPPPRGFARP